MTLHTIVSKIEQSNMQPSKVRTKGNTRSQLYYKKGKRGSLRQVVRGNERSVLIGLVSAFGFLFVPIT
jgi:hypothetical protein